VSDLLNRLEAAMEHRDCAMEELDRAAARRTREIAGALLQER